MHKLASAKNNVPPANVQQVPDIVPEKVPELLPEQVPDLLAEQVPDLLAEQVPDSLPEQVPDSLPEQIFQLCINQYHLMNVNLEQSRLKERYEKDQMDHYPLYQPFHQPSFQKS